MGEDIIKSLNVNAPLGDSAQIYLHHATCSSSDAEEDTFNLDDSLPSLPYSAHFLSLSYSRAERRQGLSGMVKAGGGDVARGVPVGCRGESGRVPWLPFVNGLMRGLIKLNELPDYLRILSEDGSQQKALMVPSPGRNASTSNECTLKCLL